jgi:hypothetical protein
MRTGYLDRASGQWVDTAPAHDFPEPQPEPEAPAAAPLGGPAVSTLAQRAAAIKVLRHPNATPGDIADARQTLLGFSPRQVQVGEDGLVRPMPNPNPGVALGPGALGLASQTMIAGNHTGVVEPGNIDLTTRPNVANADGSHSSVRSMSFQDEKGGPEILVPTVSEDGKIMSEDDAVNAYKQTGRHLGKFTNPDTANAYAQKLHEQQAGPLNSLITPPIPQPPGMPTVNVGDDDLVHPAPPAAAAPDPTSMTKGQKAQMLLAARQKNIGVN